MKSKKSKTQTKPSGQLKSKGQLEIERPVKERRNLRKQWRKDSEEERQGLKVQQAEIKVHLAGKASQSRMYEEAT